MKTQTWLPKKHPIARTLADVPSSREKPVLCWVNNGNELSPLWFDGIAVNWLNSKGEWTAFSRLLLPLHFDIYAQPPRPTKLEDVPDRRVIQASWTFNGKPETFLIFKVDGTWLDLKGEAGFKSYNNPLSWQLTDCIVEFETVEVEVIG